MKLVENDIIKFANAVFSHSAVPGGGGVSSLASSLGTSLGGMVLNLTFGKSKYAEFEGELKLIISRLDELKDELLELVDKDSECFLPLSEAYRLPADTEEEKIYKYNTIQTATKTACECPVLVVKKSYEAIGLLEKLPGKTVNLAVSDIAVGMILLRAGLVGGWMNVLTNLSTIDDEEYKDNVRSSLEYLVQDGVHTCDKVCKDIEKLLEDDIGGKNG